MHFLLPMSQKGQITIPKKLRSLFNLRPNTVVRVSVESKNNSLRIEPVRRLSEAQFPIKVKKELLKKYPIDTIRKSIEDNYGIREVDSGRF